MTSKFANDALLTLGLVADVLSVSKETVRKWLASGKVKATGGGMKNKPLFKWFDLGSFPIVRPRKIKPADVIRRRHVH